MNPLNFGKIRTDEGRIILDRVHFIFSSVRGYHYSSNCAAEMAPYLAMVGEFRVHYAGFLIRALAILLPEWDHGACEVRCHEAFVLEHGQSWDDWSMKRWRNSSTALWNRCASNYRGSA